MTDSSNGLGRWFARLREIGSNVAAESGGLDYLADAFFVSAGKEEEVVRGEGEGGIGPGVGG